MVNAKKYFSVDYWGDDWYNIDAYKYSFYYDVFKLTPLDLSFKRGIKSIYNNLKNNPISYIKNIIYYFPVCWYMFKMYIKHKLLIFN